MPDPALIAGVHLHGAAADELLAAHDGPLGMSGAEVMQAARELLNRAVYAARR